MNERAEVIQEWFEEYRDELYRHSLFVLGNPHDAEDAVAETFIRALKYLSSFKGNSSPRTWLWSILRNFMIDAQRKRSKELNSEAAIDLSQISVDDSFDRLVWEEALQQLSVEQRQVFSLRMLQGFDTRETASIMSWRDVRVRVVLHRAKQNLQRYLSFNSQEDGSRWYG